MVVFFFFTSNPQVPPLIAITLKDNQDWLCHCMSHVPSFVSYYTNISEGLPVMTFSLKKFERFPHT